MLEFPHSCICIGQLLQLNVNRGSRNSTVTTTTTSLRPFVRDYPGEPVPEDTLTHPQSWSSSNLYQLLSSTTIHSILPAQTACLAIFLHNLCPCRLWSTSSSEALHLIFAVVSTLYHLFLVFLSTPYLELSFTLTLHIHLTILISARWSATSFSFLTGQVSLPCSMILLRTQLLYSLPLLINYTVCPRKNGPPKYNGVVFEILGRHLWNFYNRI